jgi:exonuclease VII small subunit
MTATDQNFSQNFRQLQQLVAWFEQQRDIDVEEGMLKAKLAAELIQRCSHRLSQLENEFTAIKQELDAALTAPGDEKK